MAATQRTRDRWFLVWPQYRFAALLGALLLLLLALPLVRVVGPDTEGVLSRLVVVAALALVLASAVFAVSHRRRTAIVAVVLAAPVLVAKAFYLASGSPAASAAKDPFGIAFLAFISAIILRHIFNARRVTADTVCASLCLYLMLGLLWAMLYSFVDILAPGSFDLGPAASQAGASMQFGGRDSVYPIYFSFITMTTVGYGDIVPRSSVARMLAVLEAVTGQVYLAVLVARMVGLHIMHSSAPGGGEA